MLAGYVIAFEPVAIVYHRAWRAEANYVSVRYAYGRGQGGYYAKHLAARDWYMLWKLAHALKRRVARMLAGGKGAVTGELAWIAGWMVGTTDWLSRPGRLDERYTLSGRRRACAIRVTF